jgi:hypothetical protein
MKSVKRKISSRRASERSATKSKKATLLAGGNPQIAKAEGDVVDTVPGVRKAVKWNSPFYGIEGKGWFLSFHCFTKYVKVTFFRGTSLRPMPPGASKHEEVRYLDIHENDHLDEASMASWLQQAAAIRGWGSQ